MTITWQDYMRDFGKIPAYHGTNCEFDTPDFSRVGENTSDLNNANLGFCLSTTREYAMNYAKYRASYFGGEPTVLKAHIQIESPYEITNSELEDICQDAQAAENFKQRLIDDGYDSVIILTNHGDVEICCFYAEQIHILRRRSK